MGNGEVKYDREKTENLQRLEHFKPASVIRDHGQQERNSHPSHDGLGTTQMGHIWFAKE